MASFNFRDRIRGYISSKPANEIFTALMEDVEFYFNRPCTDMAQMKLRENKKLKGDIWEEFCKQWLLASNKYSHVYLFKELTEEIKTFLRLPPKQDEGIDIIAFIGNVLQPVAIQCKYRKPKNHAKVSWKTLSTFVGLCAITGVPTQYRIPSAGGNSSNSFGIQQGLETGYVKTVVMTNCSGVTRKVKCPTDQSICAGTFRNTPMDVWLKLAGIYDPKIVSEVKVLRPKTVEELREKRLQYYKVVAHI